MYNSPYGNQFGTYIPQSMNYPSVLPSNVPAQNNVPSNPQYVNGIESAKAYQLQPNQSVMLFDQNEPLMYVKTADASGFCSIKTFRMTEVTDDNTEKYVTHDEFEKFKAEMKKSVKKKDDEK